jgi:bifunctional diaminopimelate decarboxylase / aspartate kinase
MRHVASKLFTNRPKHLLHLSFLLIFSNKIRHFANQVILKMIKCRHKTTRKKQPISIELRVFMNAQAAKPWIVLKFGGSSVGQAANWQVIKQQVELQLAAGKRPFLVLSALKNISNLLEALLHQALAGVHPLAIKYLKQQHLNFAAQLDLSIHAQLSPWFEQLEQACQQIYQQKTISPQSHAQVLAFGELLSTTIGAAFLSQHNLNATWLDARQLLKSDNDLNDPWHHFTSSQCNYQPNQQFELLLAKLINKHNAGNHNASSIEPSQNVVITQGFIASDHQQQTVLLGREGSDTSAAYFGSLLKAEQVQIWTDVPGVFSTNPQQNNQARQLPHLSFSEAAQMAKFGAKVLHPRALKPVSETNIAVIVKSTLMPSETGSLINAEMLQTPLVKAIVVQSPVVMIEAANAPLESELKPNLQANSQASTQSSRQSCRETLESLTAALLMQGYDQVLMSHDKAILRYVNSDRVEPDLTNFDHSNECLTYKDKALISIIGNVNSDYDWATKVKSYCIDKLDVEPGCIFSQLSEGRLSLLIDEARYEEAASLLHQKFIVESENQHGWGPSWQHYCQRQKT